MDFKERMEQMRRDMERRRQEMDARMADFRTRVGADAPTAAAPLSFSPSPFSPGLKQHPGLEDESVAKLAMFERLYRTYPVAGFGQYRVQGPAGADFAPLVNLLASIGEIELYVSLRSVSRRFMSEPLDKGRSMYWDFLRVLKDRRCSDFLKPYLGDVRTVSKQINVIRMMRNRANHKEVLGADSFSDFFVKCYIPFFNESIAALIPLKNV